MPDKKLRNLNKLRQLNFSRAKEATQHTLPLELHDTLLHWERDVSSLPPVLSLPQNLSIR